MDDPYEPDVRPATGADLGELTRLAMRCRDHVGAQKGGDVFLRREARPPPVRASLSTDLTCAANGSDAIVLIGSLGVVPVGYAVAGAVTTVDGPIAVVTDLYVEPEARGVGLGRLLMEALIDWAEATGCRGIDAEALPGDRATKNFFEAFGLVARKITVHRGLSPGD